MEQIIRKPSESELAMFKTIALIVMDAMRKSAQSNKSTNQLETNMDIFTGLVGAGITFGVAAIAVRRPDFEHIAEMISKSIMNNVDQIRDDLLSELRSDFLSCHELKSVFASMLRENEAEDEGPSQH